MKTPNFFFSHLFPRGFFKCHNCVCSVLKSGRIFCQRGNFNWIENDFNMRKKIIAVSYFSKCSIVDAWQGSKYASGFEFPRVLNSRGFWIYFWFWMCQSFGYIRILNMHLVLNMSGFWIHENSEFTRVTQGLEYDWTIPEIPEYTWLCLNMLEYAGISVHMSKSAWMVFVLHFPISAFILQSLFFLNTWILIWSYSLKEHGDVFLKRQNLIV